MTKAEQFKNDNKEYGLGSITDGEYSLEIRLENTQNMKSFKRGCPVTITGYVKTRMGKLSLLFTFFIKFIH